MTREEALKIIDLNAGRHCNSMQEAIKTILQDGEKIEAVKKVLRRRRQCLLTAYERTQKGSSLESWYAGKMDGYQQAIDLLGESMKSIIIELD